MKDFLTDDEMTALESKSGGADFLSDSEMTALEARAGAGDFSTGFKRSFAQLPELAYGAGALAGLTAERILGEGGVSTAAKNYFAEKFSAKQQENQKYAPAIEFTDAWDRLKSGDLGGMTDWLQDSAGYVIGQGIQTLATGGVGAVAGKAALTGATEKTLGAIVAKGADKIVAESAGKIAMQDATKMAAERVAQAIGAGVVLNAQNLGMEAGDIYGGLTEQAKKEGREITGEDLARAWGSAGAAALTETATDMLGLGALSGRVKIPGAGGRVARGATAAAVGMPVEAGQEYIQTGLEQYGAGRPLDTEEAARERVNAAAVGAVGGGLMGAGIGAVTKPEAVLDAPDVDTAIDTAEKALALPLYAGEPLVSMPDGSTMTRAEYEQRRLDGMVQPATGPMGADIPAMSDRLGEIEQGRTARAGELQDFLRDEQTDLAYRRRDAAAGQMRDADFARAQTQVIDEQLAAAPAVADAQGFDSAEPTAMQLALQRARQRQQPEAPAGSPAPVQESQDAGQVQRQEAAAKEVESEQSRGVDLGLDTPLTISTSRRGSPIITGPADAIKAAEPAIRAALPGVAIVGQNQNGNYTLVVSRSADRAAIQSAVDAINQGTANEPADRGTDAVVAAPSSAGQGADVPGSGSDAQALPAGPEGRMGADTAIPVPGSQAAEPVRDAVQPAPVGQFEPRPDGTIRVRGYTADEMRAAAKQIGARVIVGGSGNAVFAKGTSLFQLKEALNPGAAYLPAREEVPGLANLLPEFVENGKLNIRKAYSHVRKHGTQRFQDKAGAQGYADALAKGEGGEWAPKRVNAKNGQMGYWHAERIQDNRAADGSTPRTTSDVAESDRLPLSVGVSSDSTEPVTVRDGVVYIGDYPAQNFDTGEDVVVPAGAGDQQIKDALTAAGAIGKRQRFFGATDTAAAEPMSVAEEIEAILPDGVQIDEPTAEDLAALGLNEQEIANEAEEPAGGDAGADRQGTEEGAQGAADEGAARGGEGAQREPDDEVAKAKATLNTARKEPWQMTRAEWEREREAVRPEVVQSDFTKASGSQAAARAVRLERLLYGVTESARQRLNAAQRGEVDLSKDEVDSLLDRINTPVSHEDVVAKAVAEGKPVPAEVLAEYPGLQGKETSATRPSEEPHQAKDTLKTVAEMSPADLLRAAADKMDAEKQQEYPETDGIDQRIADAEAAGVVLSEADKAAIRESLQKAATLRAKANGIRIDPMSKGNAFPMGVGFTKMTKRAEQRIDASVRRAGEAVEIYKKADAAEANAEALLTGKGTEADKARKSEQRAEMQRKLIERLLNWKKGDKIGGFTIERVNFDKGGYPSSYTISGDGIVKGVMDKVDVAREFFGGSKDALRKLVNDARAESRQEAPPNQAGGMESRSAPTATIPDAIIANPLNATEDNSHTYAYAKAGSVDHAMRLAKKLVTPDLVASLKDAAAENPLVVGVVSIEETGKNALPQAGAEVLAHKLGLETSAEIVQATRPHRTHMSGLARVFNRPEFDGQVEPGRSYVLVDDTITQGGTLAAMANHIEAGGGRVVAIVALTGKQYSAKLSPSAESIQQVREKFGDIEDDFRQATGYGFDGLTESEARYLTKFNSPAAVRDRILAEALEAAKRQDEEDARGLAESRQEAPERGLSVSEDQRTEAYKAVKAAVESFKQNLPGAAALDFHVASTAFDIPARYRPSPFADGVYHSDAGLVYLITTNLRNSRGEIDLNRVNKVLLHESVGHYGLMTMMGDDFKPILGDVFRLARAKGDVSSVRAGDADYATVEAVKRAYPEADDELIAMEVLARMAETGTGNKSLLQITLARIRQWLRKMAKQLGLDIDFTMDDARDLVMLAAEYLRRGDNLETAPAGEMALASQAAESRAGAITDDIALTYGQPGSAATVNAGSRMNEETQDSDRWAARDMSKIDDLIYSLQDKQIDTRRTVEAIRKASGDIADQWNPYLQEELFHGRSAKGVKDFLDFELKPLLVEMQARGVEMSDFEEYLWNRHAEERNRQIAKINPEMPDGGSGLKTADARKYLAELPEKRRAAFEALAKRIDAINAKTRQSLIQAGLEKAETVAAWEGAYKHYVPLQRDDIDSGGIGTSKGYSVRGSSVKRAMGSGRPVADIIANIAQQRERAVVRAEKNRVAVALLGLAAKNPNPDFWTVDNAPKERVVENKAVYTVRDANGDKLAEFTNMGEADTFAGRYPGAEIAQTFEDRVTERIVPGFVTRDNVVSARINGEDHYVVFDETDPRAVRMAAALKNIDVDQMGRVLSVVGKMTRYFASINTQYNPVFGVINLFRDTQGALMNLSTTAIAGDQKKVLGYTVEALRGIYSDVRAHRRGERPSSSWAQLWEEFQKEGGQTGYRDQYANAAERSEAIEKELRRVGEGKAKTFGRAVFDWLSDYNETMENAVRLAAYRAAKERGVSNQQAASLAKNLTVNFNRKGQIATQAGALYAFFNASVQGTARLAETLAGPMGKKIIGGGILLGSMQAMLFALAGYDDDEPPEFVRERALILPLPDGKYLSLPMPLGFHILPNLGRIPTEFVMSGFREPGRRIADLLGIFTDAFNPIGNAGLSLQTISPTVIDPLAALAENRDWTGKPIAKENMNPLAPKPGHLLAKDTASEIGKAASYWINVATGGTKFKPGLVSPTPDQLDYLIGQATGGVGREYLKAEQTVSSTISGEDMPLYKVPLVGRFVGTTEGQSAEGGRFYANVKRINEHEAEIKGRRSERGDVVGYLRNNPEARLVQAGNAAERVVSELRAAKRKALEAGNAERVRLIDMQITARMRRFNEMVQRLEDRQRPAA